MCKASRIASFRLLGVRRSLNYTARGHADILKGKEMRGSDFAYLLSVIHMYLIALSTDLSQGQGWEAMIFRHEMLMADLKALGVVWWSCHACRLNGSYDVKRAGTFYDGRFLIKESSAQRRSARRQILRRSLQYSGTDHHPAFTDAFHVIRECDRSLMSCSFCG